MYALILAGGGGWTQTLGVRKLLNDELKVWGDSVGRFMKTVNK